MQLPLEMFVFLGSFAEEVISPIPSFVVMIPAGAAAQVQGVPWWYLPVLGLIGGVGRMLGSIILYVIADKAEDWLLSRGRRFFGVSHRKMERFGERFSGKPRDFMVLFFLNALPVIPTALLSLSCGFIKVNLRMFITATFLGATINAIVYLGVGYAGVQAITQLRSVESVFQVISLILAISLLGWLVYYMQKRRGR